MSFLLAVSASRQADNRIGIKRIADVRLIAGILAVQQRAKHGRSLLPRWAGPQDRLSSVFGLILDGALHDDLTVRVPGVEGVIKSRSSEGLVAGGEARDEARAVVAARHCESVGRAEVVASRPFRCNSAVDEVAIPPVPYEIEDGLRHAPRAPRILCQTHVDPARMGACVVQAVVKHHPAVDEPVPLHSEITHAVLRLGGVIRVILKERCGVGFGFREARHFLLIQSREILQVTPAISPAEVLGPDTREVWGAFAVELPALRTPKIEVPIGRAGNGNIDELSARAAETRPLGKVIEIVEGIGVVLRDGHHGAGRIAQGAGSFRRVGGVIRPEDDVHPSAFADARDGGLIGAKLDRRLALSVQDDGVFKRTDGVADEIELHAILDGRVGGEGDGVVEVGIASRCIGAVSPAMERAGGHRVTEEEEQLAMVLERVAMVGGFQTESRLRLTDRRFVELMVGLAGELADLFRGPLNVGDMVFHRLR